MAGLILLRDLPGIGTLEWRLAEHGWTEANRERADDLCEIYFGIIDEDTFLRVDEDGKNYFGGVDVTGTPDELLKKAADWEQHFEVLRYFRDESDAFWKSVGWDVTDGEGKQLEVMRLLGRVLVCVVKKLHADAALNIDNEQDAEAWGARLEEEAKLFKPTP